MDKYSLVALMQRRRRRSQQRSRGRIWQWVFRLGMLGSALSLLAILLTVSTTAAVAYTAAAAYHNFARSLPAAEEVRVQTTQASFKTTLIYDRTGQTVLYEIYDPQGGNRIPVSLAAVPASVRNAAIALEDRNFYDNIGFDPRGITRAFLSNLKGERVQGGSSITQQLIKNVIIPEEQRTELSYTRKLKEMVLAVELSRQFSGREGKDQILEWYLNTIFYGNQAYGVEAAAQTYFGKHVGELTLAEAATLAPIPQYPAINPLNPALKAETLRRRNVVLDLMAEQGYITDAEAAHAKQQNYVEPPHLQEKRDRPILVPHFSFYVRRLLEQRYGTEKLYKGGLKVYTSIDLGLQAKAEQIVREQMAALAKAKKNANNAALVALDPRTGEVLAMVGNVDYYNAEIDGEVNIAISPRQPGSSFKPFTYVTAFMNGYNPATSVGDAPVQFPDGRTPYRPVNYDGKFHGNVTLRGALANSYNIPAVKLLNRVGVRNVINTAHTMGINTLNADYYGLALTLGGGEVTLLDMTYAYSVFANNGMMVGKPVPPEMQNPGFRELDPVSILRVEDGYGNVVEQYDHPQTKQVIPAEAAYMITDILSDNKARTPAFGPNSPLKLSRPAAVKTGTTNDWKDNWTLGFTPQLAVGVWVGNADNQEMQHISGVDGAGPIWHNFMETALKDQPVMAFSQPAGLERRKAGAVAELFIIGSRPIGSFDTGSAVKAADAKTGTKNAPAGKKPAAQNPPPPPPSKPNG